MAPHSSFVSLSAPGLRGVFRPVPLAAIAGVAAAVVLFVFDPSRSTFYPGCIFYRTTGLLCPGCGCLRALHQLLHGHLATALRCNPLLIITLFAALVLASRAVLTNTRFPQDASENNRLRRCGRYEIFDLGRLSEHPGWVWTFLALVLAFWVLRNLPGPVFALLRP